MRSPRESEQVGRRESGKVSAGAALRVPSSPVPAPTGEPRRTAFSLPRRRGEGGRRSDEGCGPLRRYPQPLTPTLSPHPMKGEGEHAAHFPTGEPRRTAFSLPRRRGEGGRRPDEGCGPLRRYPQPLTPALSPHPMKGEGEYAAHPPTCEPRSPHPMKGEGEHAAHFPTFSLSHLLP